VRLDLDVRRRKSPKPSREVEPLLTLTRLLSLCPWREDVTRDHSIIAQGLTIKNLGFKVEGKKSNSSYPWLPFTTFGSSSGDNKASKHASLAHLHMQLYSSEFCLHAFNYLVSSDCEL
jgi:hypothetical protein